MRDSVLVTGGAGYIGSVLVRLLLKEGYKVKVADNLSFGGESIVSLLDNENFTFVNCDIRDADATQAALVGVDHVVHLAAIVGDPACAKQPELAREINFEAAKKLFKISSDVGIQRFVFASTCSNYGKMEDHSVYLTEEANLSPVSLYAETKVAFEKFLLESNGAGTSPIILRFSTVYGLSPRLRFDLTVNEFTRDLASGKDLDIFGKQFWRPYCHVRDLARSVLTVLGEDIEKVESEVFNVGNTDENYSKQMLVEEIVKQIPEGKINYVDKNEDPRDYKVSFEKIKEKLGFKTTRTVPEGINEIKWLIDNKFISDPYDQRFRNS